MSSIIDFFAGVTWDAHVLAKDSRVSLAGSNFECFRVHNLELSNCSSHLDGSPIHTIDPKGLSHRANTAEAFEDFLISVNNLSGPFDCKYEIK